MPAPGCYVLVVEDDMFIQKILATKLRKEGFEVEVVAMGEQALAMARKRAPGAVLLDLLLPGMSGLDLLAAMRGDESLANVQVIVLSNLADPEDAARARMLGATDVLMKSDLSVNDIAHRVRMACERRVKAA